GEIIAGARAPGEEGTVFADARNVLRSMVNGPPMSFSSGENTIIGAVVTNARLDKKHCTLVAQMAQAGVARTVRPAQTAFDGDTMFALATGEVEADVNIVGAFAVETVMEAILRAVRKAEGVAGLPAWADLQL
ncbi:MAG: P1 family peptidase, partial [Anaerolineales bacterium]